MHFPLSPRKAPTRPLPFALPPLIFGLLTRCPLGPPRRRPGGEVALGRAEQLKAEGNALFKGGKHAEAASGATVDYGSWGLTGEGMGWSRLGTTPPYLSPSSPDHQTDTHNPHLVVTICLVQCQCPLSPNPRDPATTPYPRALRSSHCKTPRGSSPPSARRTRQVGSPKRVS